MPKLWMTDDYEECLELPGPDDPDGVYCTATVVLKPNNQSDLWRLIENFSSDYKRHFNHAVLKRGICIQRCQQIVQQLSLSIREALSVDSFPISTKYKFDEDIFHDTAVNRAKYDDLVEICINKQLNDTYGLVAHAEVQSCDTSSSEMRLDALDYSFLIIFLLLIVLVILSSWYDSSINFPQNVSHFQQGLDSKRKMVWTSFSIQRNWYRLTSRSHDETHKKLRFFQALRFFTMTLVIFGHSILLIIFSPTTHPEKLEKLYHNVGSMILTNGVQITQTFLAMSGTLLAVQFLELAEKRKGKVSILYVPITILYRYIRLTPAYAFVILFHATWLLKLQKGPFWRWGAETEQVFCRRNWWTNLLYINNYVHADQPCLQQGWYLGAEFQVFVIAFVVLVAIVNLPRLKIAILTLALAVAYTIPALFIYYERLEGTFVMTLEAQRYVLWHDMHYLRSYIPAHMNFGNYMLGVLTGVIHVALRARSINLAERKWFRVLWYLNFPFTLLSILPSYMFYVNDFPKPSLWMAIYFVVSKNLVGISLSIFFLGMIYGVNVMVMRVLNYRFFEPLGRLAYGAFLCHTLVMRYLYLSTRGPVYFSDLTTIVLVLGSVVMSCLMGLLLCLLIELPTSALQKQLFGSLMDHKKHNQIDPEEARAQNDTAVPIEAGLVEKKPQGRSQMYKDSQK
ncbi:nose resistant to fluoxetine protein 6-like [Anopheles albimanus]|uniref:nose resistant to fluoxetine protein 6-like n=1 Tax=Anopheles albimanus TaxID=7167 RepID=UPI00163EF414|nr:nose resistant to fluoxetine protein 6-like [Anopheles albimanus]